MGVVGRRLLGGLVPPMAGTVPTAEARGMARPAVVAGRTLLDGLVPPPAEEAKGLALPLSAGGGRLLGGPVPTLEAGAGPMLEGAGVAMQEGAGVPALEGGGVDRLARVTGVRALLPFTAGNGTGGRGRPAGRPGQPCIAAASSSLHNGQDPPLTFQMAEA